MSGETKPLWDGGAMRNLVSLPGSTANEQNRPDDRRAPSRKGPLLAFLLAVLITLGLIAWTVGPRPNPAYGHGWAIITIIQGQVALTATASATACAPWTNGTQGGDRTATFGYELVNQGSTEVAVSVIVVDTSSGFHVVAQRPYTLGPGERVDDTIQADVPFLGACPALPLALGMSSQGSA